MRHEVPVEIIDPFLFVERDGQTFVLTNRLECDRIAAVLPGATLALMDDLGLFDLIDDGMSRTEAELEVVIRAVAQWDVRAAAVAPDLPVQVADRLRAEGVQLTVDPVEIERRRRVKTPAELAGIRRALRAAEAGIAAGEHLIRCAERVDGRLRHDGEPLTAEMVRHAVRSACAALGAPAPPDIVVASALSGGGHDPGSGPLPADLPITIDVWPRDETSGCCADMARTFVAGQTSAEVALIAAVVREALEAARAGARAGTTGRAVYDLAAQVIEDAGFPTQRTRQPGVPLTTGFSFSLGHGVGLEVHEPPGLGLAGGQTLVAGDVVAIEPGVDGLEHIGGVMFEDLLLITDDGCETLTQFAYDL
ncbi:MAG: Xaa-Pro aminopeptidase [Solirubrobacteraceae bacterium]|jgi:Xaa-Pro aminopeptidase|nr:Xaa-Pro aminopeptidase [Solirubrobacteraceae bacterium]